MALSAGFDFRSTSGYVTDTGTNTFVNDSSTYNYPWSAPNGATAGWETPPAGGNSRDRNAALDARLAGIVFTSNGSGITPIFRVDLPLAGIYSLSLALGDAGNANFAFAEVRDTTTVLVSIGETTTAIEEFVDASGTLRSSAAAWVTNQATSSQVFSTTICRLAIKPPSSFGAAVLAYFYIFQDSTQTPLYANTPRDDEFIVTNPVIGPYSWAKPDSWF